MRLIQKLTKALRRRKGKGILVVRPGDDINLSQIDPAETAGYSKSASTKKIEALRERLAQLQEALFAEHERSLLIVVQAMDTGGKDGAIKNLCHGLDPNGVQLTNFKIPSAEERDHDYLWRVHRAAPRKGAVGLWNRSHYEDVLVPLVHGEITKETWRDRCEEINAFEKLLSNNGVTILKFFLHISKKEQKCRLEERLKEPDKLWKFNPGDLAARKLWEDYERAYEEVINCCSTKHAPWLIVPADRKWMRNLIMLETVVATLEKMKPKYPAMAVDPKKIKIE